MKKIFYFSFLLCISFSPIYGQIIQTGGFRGQFGIDADKRSGYANRGVVPSPKNTDDWFALSGDCRRGVIGRGKAAYYKSLLQNNKNIRFSQRMSVPVYTVANGTLWLDAIYSHDYITKSNGKDSTSFINAINAQDPNKVKGGHYSSAFSGCLFSSTNNKMEKPQPAN